MSSAGQSKLRKCSQCEGIGHNKRTCPITNFAYLNSTQKVKGQSPKATLKQQMFLMEEPVIDLVHKVMEKGFFPSKSEFYRHCIMNELEHWFDWKKLIHEEEF